MPSIKSENPKPRKTAKSSAPVVEENLTMSSGTAEVPAQRKGPQAVENPSQSAAVRSISQKTQNGQRLQNGASQVTDEQIRERAYQLYLERGRQHGSHEDDWHRAEAELRGHKR